MGGNAIKTTSIRRYNRIEYDTLCEKVRRIFTTDPRVAGTRIHITQCFRDKQDFGDIDILIQEPSEDSDHPRDLIFYKNLFETKEIHRNGSVVSMEHEGFQIDFIEVPMDEFEIAKEYFDFNDISNLIGKVARTLGLKYGHRGLTYTIRDGLGDKVGEIPVTKNPEEALRFLGYDWERFQKGFNNLEEIFEFVVSSKYFDASVYALDQLNHVDRIRDKKRATYQAFLTWIEGKTLPVRAKRDDRSTWFLPQIRRAFPEFAMLYDLAQAQQEKRAKVKTKFNGIIVSELTGLKEKELGNFMLQWRSWFKNEYDFQDYVLYASSTALSEAITEFHKKLISKGN